MGCGISTLDAEEASQSRRANGRQRAVVPPPVTDNKKKDFDNGDDGVCLLEGKDVIVEKKPLDDNNEEAKTTKEVGSIEDKLKMKCVMDKEEEEGKRVFEREEHGGDDKHAKNNVKNEEEREENNDRDDSFILPGSPSFRDYCIDYDSADRSSMGDSNDCESGGDDSINIINQPENEQSVNSNKEPEAESKERRGRGFRNVINRGKTKGGRRNLLNFGCYNASGESYAEGSLNKIVGKTA